MLKFSQIAFILQMPHLNLIEEARKIEGETLDENALEKRARYVSRWLEKIAEGEDKLTLRNVGDTLPQLSPAQQMFLRELSVRLASTNWTPEEIQKVVFECAKSFVVKECFEAIYLLFFNKSSGPIVGWFLSSLNKEQVLERLDQV